MKRQHYIHRILKFLFVPVILLILTGCHSNYVVLSCSVKSTGAWNNTKTELFFAGRAYAYKRPKGISTFPVGGQAKPIYESFNIYRYDTLTNKIVVVANISHLPKIHFTGNIFVKNSLVYYNLYTIDINSGKINSIDSAELLSVKESISDGDIVSSFNLKKKIADAPVAGWGLYVQEINPKSEDSYIKDYIKDKGGDCTRSAIFQQIIYKQSDKVLYSIMKKMKEYGNGIEGYKQSIYEQSTEYEYIRINKLLIKKEEK